ncbi:hypothetical protein [Azospirillum canadense]|uniref:hypothetical protein n=1 Tax=Azospirillum canadense TaxID=403962 RepID=UPI00222701B1|nr:hypothetical protein [Azospirillum canadense]MCW2242210.1 hypothetical protein [Azospirillum canadense]
MTAARRIRTSLERHQPRPPANADDLHRMGAAAWHQGRGLWIPERTLAAMDDIGRAFVEQVGGKLYGKRVGLVK